jgi:uncharacterized membrane protein
MAPAAAAGLLLALVVPALLINVYFTSLILERWARLRGRLAWLFHACGAETSTCAVVVKTPYARIFGGVPNVALGIVWCLALTGLALTWLATGHVSVPWPFLFVAAGTLVVAVYLVYALVVVLKQPCPL